MAAKVYHGICMRHFHRIVFPTRLIKMSKRPEYSILDPQDHASEDLKTESPSTSQKSNPSMIASKNVVLPNDILDRSDLEHPKDLASKSYIGQKFENLKSFVNRIKHKNPSIHAQDQTPKIIRHRSPREISKIVIIGIHGWFPGRLLQTGNYSRLLLIKKSRENPLERRNDFSRKQAWRLKTIFPGNFKRNCILLRLL